MKRDIPFTILITALVVAGTISFLNRDKTPALPESAPCYDQVLTSGKCSHPLQVIDVERTPASSGYSTIQEKTILCRCPHKPAPPAPGAP